MSLAAAAISEEPICAQLTLVTRTKPPKRRQTVAKADIVAAPEAR
jgi:hypothetical protein